MKTYFDEPSLDYEVTETLIDDGVREELATIAARYPQARSALLPMLHLVQSVEGRVTPAGIEACADILGLSHGRRLGRRDLLHDVQAASGREVPRRRLHHRRSAR